MELHRTNHGQVKRDLATNKRLRRLTDGNFEPVPLNLGLGTHYTWVYAGSPPQRASVIVDTGSHLMAFPCNGYAHPSCNVVVPNSCIRCDGCGTHTDAPFDTTKSSSLTYPSCASHLGSFTCGVCGLDDQCHISQSYTEGSSWNAVVVEDNVWLGDAVDHPSRRFNESFGTRYMFGCQKRETGLFISQVADGIMGVANTENNLIRKLHAEHKVDTSAFALCFAPQGGTMAIGTLSTAHHSTDVQYAAVTSSHNGWYGVTVIALTFGGTNLPIDASFMGAGRNVIVDSGTTDSYLPSAYADAWNDLFFKTTGHKYAAEGGGCDDTTYPDDVVQAMPAFDITMLASSHKETSHPTSTTGKVLVNDTVGATSSSNFRGKTDMSGEFSLLSAAVAMCLALVVIGSAYHFWYKRRNKSSLPSTGKSPHWAPVSQIQSDPDERVPLGEEPLSRRGDEEDESDGDEFFDSEGYVMSPRSIKRCRDAFDLDA
ncbi:hypothetical protein B5M09_006115 [Aphanomyces astaci]|uniref:Peptidase A1 domain-containing protein n=1 Tax=Aphanomyces astaci TaxID=112090 RepID=A0A425C3H8_APHAT|nr:hypothetical protein B5M09_006115 [Aphanomyces astaci]